MNCSLMANRSSLSGFKLFPINQSTANSLFSCRRNALSLECVVYKQKKIISENV